MSAPALVGRLLALPRLAWRPGGAAAALLIVYGYFLALIAVGGRRHWDVFYVPDLQPAFLDMRSVTSAWECARRGIEVLSVNPCDPTGRPANYPRLWLLPAYLGLGEEATLALGLLVALAFLGSLALLLRGAPLAEGIVVGAAAVSPPVMLGVERGNVDLLLVALLAVSVLLLTAGRAAARAAGQGGILLAALLKLFPVFALATLLRPAPGRRRAGFALATAAFLAYGLATLDDVRTILRVVPQATWFSYGAEIGPDSLRRWLGDHLWSALDGPVVGAAATPLLLALAALAALLLARRKRGLPAGQDPAVDAFVAGAAVYAGSFAFAHNWDYRLAFLLLTLPQLVRWSRGRRAPVPLPRLTLLAVLVALWLADTVDPAQPVDEVANWFLFVSLTSALAALLLPRAVTVRRPGRGGGQAAATRS